MNFHKLRRMFANVNLRRGKLTRELDSRDSTRDAVNIGARRGPVITEILAPGKSITLIALQPTANEGEKFCRPRIYIRAARI